MAAAGHQARPDAPTRTADQHVRDAEFARKKKERHPNANMAFAGDIVAQ